MGIGRLGRLYISPQEYDSLVVQYRDPSDPNRVCYYTFETDIDTVFTTRGLEKTPTFAVVVPPPEVADLPRHGAKDWELVESDRMDLCELALDKIKRKIQSRGIIMKPSFRDYDK